MNLFVVSSLLLVSLGQTAFAALADGCNCRLPAMKRIVNGDTSANLIPFQVSVQSNGQHICGGVILDENNVLTAASCLNGRNAKDVNVVAGILRLDQATTENTFKVATINLPEGFNPDVGANNSAILQLSSPLTLKDNQIEKACLRTTDVEIETASFQGFGSTEKFTVDIEGNIKPTPEPSNELRISQFAPLPEVSSPTHYLLEPISFGDENVCFFDEGGALHVLENGKTYVIGIADEASMGPDSGDVNLADVCVQRSNFLKLSSIDFFIKKYATDKFCLV